MWKQVYAGIYYATCDVCGKCDNGWFWILNDNHDDGTHCDWCHKNILTMNGRNVSS